MHVPKYVKAGIVVVAVVVGINLLSGWWARRALARDVESSGGDTGV